MTSDTHNSARFNQIFAAHYESVSRYCHRRLRSEDANDAVAEVFAVAWRKIEKVPQGDDALPWLYGVSRNEVSRARRSIRRRGALRSKLGGQARYPSPGPEVVLVRNAAKSSWWLRLAA